MPLVDSIQADFDGDNAKLIWPVSLDGKKMQSETYKILGILDSPRATKRQQRRESLVSGSYRARE
jgi:hypothetical protein